MSPPIYLDHAATTRPLPAVVEAMQRVQLEAFGNPSSSHGFGAAPRRALADARDFLRGSVGAARLVFTSGGTEADVLGVLGACQDRPPGRVLAGAADHPAVLAQREQLQRTHHKLVEVPVDAGGTLEPEALFDVMGTDVRAVAILHGHNELGGLARLDDLVDIVRRVAPDAHVHVDLVQTYGKLPFDLDDTGVDSVAVAGHKLHGPRGIGFLALSSTARVAALQPGGGQEEGLRGGTENVAGAVGLAVAAEYMLTHLAEHAARMAQACDGAAADLAAALPRVERLGVASRRLPHVLSLRIPGVVGETLQQACDRRGVAFSTGSACHTGDARDNHVLLAAGLSRAASREVVRLSVGATTGADELAAAVAVITEEAQRLRSIAPRSRERARR